MKNTFIKLEKLNNYRNRYTILQDILMSEPYNILTKSKLMMLYYKLDESWLSEVLLTKEGKLDFEQRCISHENYYKHTKLKAKKTFEDNKLQAFLNIYNNSEKSQYNEK